MEASKIGPDLRLPNTPSLPPPPLQKKTYFYSAQGSFVAEMRFFINFLWKIEKRYNIDRYDVVPHCKKLRRIVQKWMRNARLIGKR